MDQFPSNAHTARVSTTKTTVTEKKVVEEPEKKVEKIVTGDVTRRKTPLGRRFAKSFFGEDSRGVVGYVVMEVLVPAAKDMISDAVSQGIDRMLFGESRSASRSAGTRPPGSPSYVSYNRFSSPGKTREEPQKREATSYSRRTQSFDQILLQTRAEADEVIDRLRHYIERWEACSVADLYGLVGISPTPVDENWGWTNLDLAGVAKTRRGGYILDLPEPEHLK